MECNINTTDCCQSFVAELDILAPFHASFSLLFQFPEQIEKKQQMNLVEASVNTSFQQSAIPFGHIEVNCDAK